MFCINQIYEFNPVDNIQYPFKAKIIYRDNLITIVEMIECSMHEKFIEKGKRVSIRNELLE